MRNAVRGARRQNASPSRIGDDGAIFLRSADGVNRQARHMRVGSMPKGEERTTDTSLLSGGKIVARRLCISLELDVLKN